jgi:hypothetical protein
VRGVDLEQIEPGQRAALCGCDELGGDRPELVTIELGRHLVHRRVRDG